MFRLPFKETIYEHLYGHLYEHLYENLGVDFNLVEVEDELGKSWKRKIGGIR